MIKIAWGGKSLAKDFRPPSSGGQVGPYYKELFVHVRDVLANLDTHFPKYNGQGYEIVGFGWHQGWNDRVNQAHNDAYEKNLANFIRDLRKELAIEELPFVIAETGMSGHQEKHPRALSLMKAQAAVAKYEEFKREQEEQERKQREEEERRIKREKAEEVERLKRARRVRKVEEGALKDILWNILKEVPQLQQDFEYPDFGLRLMKSLPMLFFGGENSHTFMHYDIDLANIFHFHFEGQKEILLFSQAENKFLYRVPHSLITHESIDFKDPDLNQWPALRYTTGYKTLLEHGEVLYMPEGYWHYMRYITPGFSMSLRAIARNPRNLSKALYNVFIMRYYDNLMRRVQGQKWIDWKNEQAIERTHKNLGNSAEAPSGAHINKMGQNLR